MFIITFFMKGDLISILDVKNNLVKLLELASKLKAKKEEMDYLKGKQLAMIFEKPSTRTRISFEVGMSKLGGNAFYLNSKEMQLGRGETIEDTAKVLSRYADAILYRAFSHKKMLELAKFASIPVINGLDDEEHPCQIMADLLTMKEHKSNLDGLKLAYLGDGNNVCQSLMLGCPLVGISFSMACPRGYEPKSSYINLARSLAKQRQTKFSILHDPFEAVRNADVVYTDVWVSMGEEEEKERRLKDFKGYEVNERIMEAAKPDALFMHCLPAHYGLEVTKAVAHGKQSVIFDQAENRLWAQMAILLYLFDKEKLFDVGSPLALI
jgi:ornithine carbamoyltransferase